MYQVIDRTNKERPTATFKNPRMAFAYMDHISNRKNHEYNDLVVIDTGSLEILGCSLWHYNVSMWDATNIYKIERFTW